MVIILIADGIKSYIKQPRKYLGKTSRKQSKEWFDKECQEATEEKNEVYVNMQQ